MARQGNLRALFACAVIAAAAALVAPLPADASYAKRTLKLRSHGRDVKLFQRYLDRAGYRTTADGYFGRRTRAAERRFERSARLRVDGRATRRDQRKVRAVARARADQGSKTETTTAPVAPNPGDTATLAPDGRTAIAPDAAPQPVKDAVAAANRITRKPYRYGGGHGRWEDSGYDCSGAVSYALHGGGLLDTQLDSTGLESWGSKGPGAWITVYANSGHAYVVIAGLRFDTSGGSHGESGPRWRTTARSPNGYVVRHPAGL
jgi:peptidoglycan hydrolase-like protein with peptidoglycan-binding domain